MFRRKKKNPFMGPVGVDSLAEVGRRLKYLERALMKHGMGIAADSLEVEPAGNKYVDVLLHVVLFKHAIKGGIPKEEPFSAVTYSSFQGCENVERTDKVISCICSILEEQHIPYRRNKAMRPMHQLMLPEHVVTTALVAVFTEQDKIIDELRNELYRLRGMTKNEFKEAEDLLYSEKRIKD